MSADGATAFSGGWGDNSGVGATWAYTNSGSGYTQLGAKFIGTGYVGSPNQGGALTVSADGTTAINGGNADNSNSGAIWAYVSGPTIFTNGTLSVLTTTYGTPSSSGTFNVLGSGLNAGILVTAPAGFEVSSDNTTFTPTVTIGAAGTVPPTPVYIRLAALTSVGAYAGNIVLTSTGAPTVNVATVSSTVTKAPLSLTATNVSKPYGQVLTGNANSTAFTPLGLKNTDAVTTVAIAYGTGSAASDLANTYTGQITPTAAIFSSGLASNYTITYPLGDITVTPVPTITSSGSLSALTTTYGTPSSTGTFNISGIYLTTSISVAAPAGYEISQSTGSGYAGTTTIAFVSGGTIPSTPIYIRLAAATYVGSAYAGNVVMTSSGATTINVATVTSTVNTAALSLTANNVNKPYGQVLTNGTSSTGFTPVGLMNSEAVGTVALAYGTGSLASDLAGTYTAQITPGSASFSTGNASNYTITYPKGTITVTPVPTISTSGSLAALSTTYGTASSTSNFSISGIYMTAGILTTAPAGYQVSLNATSGFAATVTIPFVSGGTIPSTPVYIRLSAIAPVATYAGNLVQTSSGAVSTNFATTSSTVNTAALSITATNVSKPYGSTLTSTAGSIGFTPVGLMNGDVVGGVSITYGPASAANAAVGTYTGQVTPSVASFSSGNLANYTISYAPANIIVTATPTISTTGSLTAQNTNYGVPTTSNTFNVSGVYMTAGMLVTAPTGFEISLTAGIGFANTVNIAFVSGGTIPSTPVYIRIAALTPVGNYSGNNVITSSGATTVNVATVSSTVSRSPLSLTATDVTKVYGATLTGGNTASGFTPSGLMNTDAVSSVNIAYGAAAAASTVAGTYTGQVTPSLASFSAGNASNYTITYPSGTITVTSVPTISTTGTLSSLITTYGTPSATGNFAVSGIYLTAGITVSAPAGYEVSLSSGSAYSTTVTTAFVNGGTIPSTPVYIRLAATTPVGTSYTGNAVMSSTGANSVAVATVSSWVGKAPLSLTAITVTKPYSQRLVNGLSSAGFTPVGLMNGDQVGTVYLSYGTGFDTGTAAGTYTGSIVPSSASFNTGSASNYTITYPAGDIIINAAPTISTTGALSALSTTYGAPSATSTFNVSAVYLTAGILATAPAGYEISLASGSGFGSSVTVAFVNGGTIPSTPLYLRLAAATAAGSAYAGNVVLSSASATSVNMATVTSTVNTAALTLTAANITKAYGATLTSGVSTSGFTFANLRNNDAVSSLTLTYGTGSAASDAAGTYTGQITPSLVTFSVGNAANYTITYPTGTITVSPVPTLSTTGSLVALSTTYGTPSSTGTFNVSGLYLTAGIPVTAPAGYEVSLSTGSGFASTVTVAFISGGTIPSTPVYVRLAALTTVGSAYSGNVGLSSTGAVSMTVATVNSTVTTAPLSLTATNVNKAYGAVITGGSGSAAFTAAGLMNTDAVSSVTVAYGSAAAAGTAAGTYTSQVTPSLGVFSTGSAANYAITYPLGSITVTPVATMSTTGSLAAVSTTYGTPSSTKTFNVSGAYMTTGITATAPTGYEVSISAGSGFGPTATVAFVSGGTIPSTPVYVRLAAITSVGTAYAGNVILASTGALSTTVATVTSTVNVAPLTVTANLVSKNYGVQLTGAAGSAAFTSTGLMNGETIATVTTNYGNGSAGNAALGTYTGTVTINAASGGSFTATNYSIAYAPANIAISATALTVTATGPSKSYGTALSTSASTTNFTVTGTTAAGENLTSVTLTPDAHGLAANTPRGSAYIVTPSSATGTGGFLASNYTITFQPYTGTVGTNILTITATGPGRVYGTALAAGTTTTNFTVSGLLNGDQVTGITLTPDANGSTATTATGQSYLVTPSAPTGNSSFLPSNYTLNFVPFSGVISPLALNIAATGPLKAYHTTLAAGSATTGFTATGLATGDVINSVTLTPDAAGLSAATASGTAYIVTPSAAVGNTSYNAANYTITYTPYTGTVSSSVLTITATGPSKTYGTVLAAATSSTNFIATGMSGSETVTGLTLTPNAAGASATTASGGSYQVIPSAATGANGFVASNYTINYIPFTGTVTPAPLTVAATGPLKKYGVVLAAGSSTSSFIATGLSGSETVTSVTLTPDAAGQAATTANGAAYGVTPSAATGANGFLTSNYTITYVPYTGTVGSTSLTITATSPNKKFGMALAAGSSAVNFTASGTLPGETVTAVNLTPDGAGLSASTVTGAAYTVVPASPTGTGGFLASNYTITYVNYTGAVIAAPLSILATGPSKAYGTALAVATSSTNFTASGAVNGDVVTGVMLSPDASGQSASTGVGSSYLVTPSASTGNGSFLASNYTITYLPFTGTVSPIALAITATGPTSPMEHRFQQ